MVPETTLIKGLFKMKLALAGVSQWYSVSPCTEGSQV